MHRGNESGCGRFIDRWFRLAKIGSCYSLPARPTHWPILVTDFTAWVVDGRQVKLACTWMNKNNVVLASSSILYDLFEQSGLTWGLQAWANKLPHSHPFTRYEQNYPAHGRTNPPPSFLWFIDLIHTSRKLSKLILLPLSSCFGNSNEGPGSDVITTFNNVETRQITPSLCSVTPILLYGIPKPKQVSSSLLRSSLALCGARHRSVWRAMI